MLCSILDKILLLRVYLHVRSLHFCHRDFPYKLPFHSFNFFICLFWISDIREGSIMQGDESLMPLHSRTNGFTSNIVLTMLYSYFKNKGVLFFIKSIYSSKSGAWRTKDNVSYILFFCNKYLLHHTFLEGFGLIVCLLSDWFFIIAVNKMKLLPHAIAQLGSCRYLSSSSATVE